jgi:hypothetical protein
MCWRCTTRPGRTRVSPFLGWNLRKLRKGPRRLPVSEKLSCAQLLSKPALLVTGVICFWGAWLRYQTFLPAHFLNFHRYGPKLRFRKSASTPVGLKTISSEKNVERDSTPKCGPAAMTAVCDRNVHNVASRALRQCRADRALRADYRRTGSDRNPRQSRHTAGDVQASTSFATKLSFQWRRCAETKLSCSPRSSHSQDNRNDMKISIGGADQRISPSI